jgi:hypothetical protein
MLIYSLIPTKPYAKQLLGFSYKKPLYSVVSFVVFLVIILLIAGHFGIYVPINGSATVTLPGNWTMGATVNALVSGAFLLPFWLAVAAAALCLGARIIHGNIAKPIINPEAATSSTVSTAITA